MPDAGELLLDFVLSRRGAGGLGVSYRDDALAVSREAIKPQKETHGNNMWPLL